MKDHNNSQHKRSPLQKVKMRKRNNHCKTDKYQKGDTNKKAQRK